MYIVQGDHGISIPFTVQKYAVAEDLTGATVEVAIKYGDNNIIRAATITDAINGECSFTVTSSDLTVNSVYSWQWTAYFPDGRIYSGRSREFYASERLIAGSGGGGAVPVIVPFATKAELAALQELVEQGGGGTGGGVLVFNSLDEVQAAYPSGINQPVWVVEENSWYYWNGEAAPPADTTAPVLTITSGGTFTGNKTVTMSVNETADIYYTLDGSTPTTSSTAYSSPLSISATTTLKAFARDNVGNSSAVQTVNYTLDTTQPADTTAPNNVTNLSYSNLAQTSLTLTWTASTSSDVASYDVFNGSTLLANVTGTTYNVTSLTASTQYTFTVRAKDTANNTASGSSVTVTTSVPADTTAPVLTITPAATFTNTQTVNLSTNETATIWYTLDDSDPITSGTRLQYTSPLTLTETDTVKAYAVDSANNASAVQTVTYTKQTSQGAEGMVSDSSLLLYMENPTNPTTVSNPDTYFNGQEDFTIAFTSTSPVSSALITRGVWGQDTTSKMKLEKLADGKFNVGLYGTRTSTGGTSYPTISSLAHTDASVPYHVAITKTSGSLKVYVNNVLEGTNSTMHTDFTFNTSTMPLTLGKTGQTHTIKNFAYYNRVLTADELTQNYNVLK
jgi:hypothetical protein